MEPVAEGQSVKIECLAFSHYSLRGGQYADVDVGVLWDESFCFLEFSLKDGGVYVIGGQECPPSFGDDLSLVAPGSTDVHVGGVD